MVCSPRVTGPTQVNHGQHRGEQREKRHYIHGIVLYCTQLPLIYLSFSFILVSPRSTFHRARHLSSAAERGKIIFKEKKQKTKKETKTRQCAAAALSIADYTLPPFGESSACLDCFRASRAWGLGHSLPFDARSINQRPKNTIGHRPSLSLLGSLTSKSGGRSIASSLTPLIPSLNQVRRFRILEPVRLQPLSGPALPVV